MTDQDQYRSSESKKWSAKNSSTKELDLYVFDPNTESLKGLMSMGFSEKLAMNFINYREKVRPFKTKKDVLDLYAVDQKLYDQLEQYIDIANVESARVLKGSSKKNTEGQTVGDKHEPKRYHEVSRSLSININEADTTELKLIKGIGSYYAKSIVKFREALGGFHSIEQLNEIYAFQKRPESLEPLIQSVFIDASKVRKMNVNLVSKEDLIMHPYLKAHVAKALFNYRIQNGAFENLEDIKKCHLVTDEIYLKIAPYLSLQ